MDTNKKEYAKPTFSNLQNNLRKGLGMPKTKKKKPQVFGFEKFVNTKF